MAPTLVAERPLAGPVHDLLREFLSADPWYTVWQYRFLPPRHVCAYSLEDHGLDHLVYYQALISEEES